MKEDIVKWYWGECYTSTLTIREVTSIEKGDEYACQAEYQGMFSHWSKGYVIGSSGK